MEEGNEGLWRPLSRARVGEITCGDKGILEDRTSIVYRVLIRIGFTRQAAYRLKMAQLQSKSARHAMSCNYVPTESYACYTQDNAADAIGAMFAGWEQHCGGLLGRGSEALQP